MGEGSDKAGDSGLGTTKDGQVAGGANKEAGSSISTGSGGFGMGTPVAASGNASSVTQSGISGGTIVIHDAAWQLALTGKTAAETITSGGDSARILALNDSLADAAKWGAKRGSIA